MSYFHWKRLFNEIHFYRKAVWHATFWVFASGAKTNKFFVALTLKHGLRVRAMVLNELGARWWGWGYLSGDDRGWGYLNGEGRGWGYLGGEGDSIEGVDGDDFEINELEIGT